MMRMELRKASLLALLVLLCGVPVAFAAEGLIPPSRSLEGPREGLGSLTVLSEPPDLEVFLDGSRIGETPVRLKEVKPGPHKLRVGPSETDVYVQPGRTVTLSLFKGSFIDVSKEKEAARQPGPEPERPTETRKGAKAPEEDRPSDLTPWQRFLNRTSPNF